MRMMAKKMNKRPDYSNMKDPGDLPGDGDHPNSPDYDDSDYAAMLENRIDKYARQLVRDNEVDTFVRECFDVADDLLFAISTSADIPESYDMTTFAQRLRAIRNLGDA